MAVTSLTGQEEDGPSAPDVPPWAWVGGGVGTSLTAPSWLQFRVPLFTAPLCSFLNDAFLPARETGQAL